MTTWEELCHVSLPEGAGDQHHHVVDHVAVAVATKEAESVGRDWLQPAGWERLTGCDVERCRQNVTH